MAGHPLQPPEWIDTAPIRVEASIDIAAPPECVWSFIVDHEGWPRWFRELSKVEVTRAPTGVGGGRRVTTHLRQVRCRSMTHIDRTFALEEVPEALRYVGEGHALGKVVVEVNVD